MTTSLDELIQRLKHPPILVTGDVLLDRYVFGVAERISPEAPVPVLLVTEQEDRLGGTAGVASLLARLEVEVMSARGGERRRTRSNRPGAPASRGLADDHVVTDPGRPTTLKQRLCGPRP